MWAEWILGLWTAAGWAWWVVSLKLVRDAKKPGMPVAAGGEPNREFLSIFKPLPKLGRGGLGEMEAGIVSFVAELDQRSELLLGVHAGDRGRLALFLEEMEICFPKVNLRIITRTEPDRYANPKIAWQEALAEEAQGELWLWSDANIVAPEGFLRNARAEFASGRAALLTFPYVVKQAGPSSAFLDALFVNADFHPGVLLLRRLGRVDFGLGAGMLFRRDDFLSRVKWAELGTELADDFHLGQKLGPVQISTVTLTTAAAGEDWRSAIAHYLRWSKTIRWNRPGGTAARLVVLPLAGWSAALMVDWNKAWIWLGWLTVWQVDVLAAILLCRSAGCRVGFKKTMVTEAWAFGRIMAWAACWIPLEVRWGDGRWEGPRKVRAQH